MTTVTTVTTLAITGVEAVTDVSPTRKNTVLGDIISQKRHKKKTPSDQNGISIVSPTGSNPVPFVTDGVTVWSCSVSRSKQIAPRP